MSQQNETFFDIRLDYSFISMVVITFTRCCPHFLHSPSLCTEHVFFRFIFIYQLVRGTISLHSVWKEQSEIVVHLCTIVLILPFHCCVLFHPTLQWNSLTCHLTGERHVHLSHFIL